MAQRIYGQLDTARMQAALYYARKRRRIRSGDSPDSEFTEGRMDFQDSDNLAIGVAE